MRSSVKFRFGLWIGFAVALALLVLVAVLSFRNTDNLIRDNHWIEQTHEVIAEVHATLSDLERIESDARGYLITRDPALEADYQHSSLALHGRLERLSSLVADNPVQLTRTSVLKDKVATEIMVLDAAIATLKLPNGFTLAKSGLSAELHSNHLQDIRSTTATIEREERKLLKTKMNQADSSTRMSFWIIISVLGLSLILILGLFALVIRDGIRRTQSDRLLSEANRELEHSLSELEIRRDEMKFLNEVSDELQICLTPAEAEAAMARFLGRLLNGSSGFIAMIHNSRNYAEVVSAWGDPQSVPKTFAPQDCCGLRAGRLHWGKQASGNLPCKHFDGDTPVSYFCMPLVAHGETLGVAHIQAPSLRDELFERDLGATLQALTERCAMALANIHLRERLRDQAIRDPLTGLFNRRFMEESLERELHRASRQKSELAVLLIDVDHFKRFNDTAGHEAGDSLLVHLSEMFLNCVRGADIVCRFGGEEFVIIMPEGALDGVVARANMLCAQARQLHIQYQGQILKGITISIGIASFPLHGSNSGELLRLADAALYRAKAEGRNRVSVSEIGRAVSLQS